LFAAGIGVFAASGSAHYVDLVGILAVMAGAIVAAVWLLRLGWIAEFLSEPIITGFLAGMAVVIVVHQLPDLLGVTGGGSSTLGRVRHAIDQLDGTCAWALVIGLGVFLSVSVSEHLNRRFPAALVALIAATALVAIFGLRSHGVAVLGHVALGAPRLGLRGLSLHAFGQVAPVAVLIALVIVTQSAATARAFERGPDSRAQLDVARDLLGVGARQRGRRARRFVPGQRQPARTAAVSAAGGRTQLTSLLAAAAVIALIAAAGVLHDVPVAALSGVLLYIATRIFHVAELRAIARFDRVEFGLAVITLVTVALLGVEQGIAVAVAILDRTRVSAQPRLHLLGRIPGTTSWAPLGSHKRPLPVPGVVVVLFATPLWYANAGHFRDQLSAALDRDREAAARGVVLDALGLGDIDYTGTAALRDVLDELDHAGIAFAIARAGERVRDELRRAGLSPGRIAETRFFSDVDAAVTALSEAHGAA
jgi:MFS superfamily sulfate permease-like transporter